MATQTAVVCSAQHWRAPVHLSAHHLAKFLARRGWRPCFLSTPTSYLHRLRFSGDLATRERFADWQSGGGWDAEQRIFHYTPLALLPPSRTRGLDGAWLMRNWPRLTWPSLAPFLASHGFGRPDLMIADSALMLPVWQSLGRPRLVYRVTDLNSAYPNQPTALRTLEMEIAHAADLVVYTGDALAPYVGSLAPAHSLCIPNGVDTAHFTAPHDLPADYANIPEPRAVFVGTVAEWFDTELIARAARELSLVSFVIIGPGSTGLGALAGLGNVFCLGTRPYATIPGYFQHASAGLIPFARGSNAAFVDSINPLKLYEYMAAGLGVVSTAFQQITDLASPARVARSPEEFIAALAALVQEPSDGVAERAFASRFDWTHQFEPLATALGI